MYIKMQLVKYKFIIVIYENILLFIKYKNILKILLYNYFLSFNLYFSDQK